MGVLGGKGWQQSRIGVNSTGGREWSGTLVVKKIISLEIIASLVHAVNSAHSCGWQVRQHKQHEVFASVKSVCIIGILY